MGREIQGVLGYESWENFEKVINKARMACEKTEINPDKHFLDTMKKVSIGSGAMRAKKDCYLSRYACYLIAMNGDSTKTQIGIAQGYFAIQTRKQEMFEKLIEEEKRIYLRKRVREAVKSLHSIAKEAGVQKYALFHDAGYRGLYKMRLSEIKAYKGIKDELLDRSGHTELAANEFRITQTKDKIKRDAIKGEKNAIDTHFNVGREVRNTIVKLGGTMPEDLPPEESIKSLERKRQKEIKGLSKQQITN
jgi:DNA-damage-inducible protein D